LIYLKSWSRRRRELDLHRTGSLRGGGGERGFRAALTCPIRSRCTLELGSRAFCRHTERPGGARAVWCLEAARQSSL